MIKTTHLAMLLIVFIVTLSGCQSISTSTTQRSLSLDGARYAHAMVNDGEKLYVIGGSNESNFLSRIEIIDPKTQQSTTLEGKIIPRRYFSAVWDGKESIYIIGGVSFNGLRIKYEKRVEVFNTRTQEVTLVKSLPAPTRTNSAALKDGKIFVFGGAYPRGGNLKYQPTVAVYDIENDSWQRGQDMPVAKSTKAFVKGDYIYLVGGYNGKQSVNTFERYDPKNNRWQSLPTMPYRISAHSLALKGEKIYVFGNYLEISASYSYDFTTQQWSKLDIGYLPARHTAATVLNSLIYVSGGNKAAKGQSMNNIQVFNL